jgi:hypothetical protein
MFPESSPQNQDLVLVLGGQTPPPNLAAVLGGVDGLRERFSNFGSEQKLSALAEIASNGVSAIDFLINAFQDKELIVRAKAYEYLKELDTEPAQTAIANGIPLFPGDCIYCVYELQVRYTDEYYYVIDRLPEAFLEASFYDLVKENYDFDDEEWAEMSEEEKQDVIEEFKEYSPRLVSSHLNPREAQEVATRFHRGVVSELGVEVLIDFDCFFNRSFNISTWLTSHGYPGINPRRLWQETPQAIEKLKIENIELWHQLWLEAVGSLAVVFEKQIDHPCYFKIPQNVAE